MSLWNVTQPQYLTLGLTLVPPGGQSEGQQGLRELWDSEGRG